MIYYNHVWSLNGSVFPRAALSALPVAILTAALSVVLREEGTLLHFLGEDGLILQETTVWASLSSFVGFLVIFRTSQAYSRFWEGCAALNQMRAEWFDACSSLVAFCKLSKADLDDIQEFQGLIVRMFSALHALTYAEIEEKTANVDAHTFELLDFGSIDEQSLDFLKASNHRVELVFQWIQVLIVENIETGILAIPPPILSRAFQELATGMVHFHDAMRISRVPFPFPYAQTCDVLLIVYAIMTPFITAAWVSTPWWAFALSFTQVFIFTCLNNTAKELQNPFGRDANDIDCIAMQRETNAQLLQILHPRAQICPKVALPVEESDAETTRRRTIVAQLATTRSMSDMWEETEADNEDRLKQVWSLVTRRKLRERHDKPAEAAQRERRPSLDPSAARPGRPSASESVSMTGSLQRTWTTSPYTLDAAALTKHEGVPEAPASSHEQTTARLSGQRISGGGGFGGSEGGSGAADELSAIPSPDIRGDVGLDESTETGVGPQHLGLQDIRSLGPLRPAAEFRLVPGGAGPVA